jgi:MinD superfamily P-loop ATPase
MALPMEKHKIGVIKHIEKDNLTLIEAKLDIGEEQAVPLINHTHDYLNENFEDINIQIIDSPPGNSCPFMATIKKVDFVILVAEPTPFGFNDFKIAYNTIRVLGKGAKVVINKSDIGDDNIENFCIKNEIPILAKIPYDKQLAEEYSKGNLYTSNEYFNRILEQIEKQIIK